MQRKSFGETWYLAYTGEIDFASCWTTVIYTCEVQIKLRDFLQNDPPYTKSYDTNYRSH
jgi:hypothetical protein